MLEEYVMTDEVSDDVGESLMIQADDDFEPPEVPFQPKPTSVSVVALISNSERCATRPARARCPPRAARRATAASATSPASRNVTTTPQGERAGRGDLHAAPTLIRENGRARNAPRPAAQRAAPPPAPPARSKPRTSAPPPPPPSKKRSAAQPIFDEELHAAPTMIIDIGRMRQRSRR